VDSVCIGLTSSNRVTFAGNATGFGLGVPTHEFWPWTPEAVGGIRGLDVTLVFCKCYSIYTLY
jgi:hypothetical protein